MTSSGIFRWNKLSGITALKIFAGSNFRDFAENLQNAKVSVSSNRTIKVHGRTEHGRTEARVIRTKAKLADFLGIFKNIIWSLAS